MRGYYIIVAALFYPLSILILITMNFSKEFSDFQYANFLQGKSEIAENMKIIVYKIIPDYFDLLDFDNDDCFLDATLFALVTAEKLDNTDLLKQYMYGFIPIENRPQKVNVLSDKYGIIYIPNIGWIKQVEKNKSFVLEFINNKFKLNGADVDIDPLAINNKIGVELLKYRLELFDDRYYDSVHNIIDIDVEEPYKAKSAMLNNSLNIIADNVPWLAQLIKEGCPKAVIFNDGTEPMTHLFCARNSFASFQVKRISFHNVYQPWYDEVFFLDDISHQMGHVLFDQITFDKKRFFKINHQDTIVANSEFGKRLSKVETRSYEIVFHSLYTFFVILNVLDACLENDLFTYEQKLEIKGRIAFYLRKSAHDFELFEDMQENNYAQTIYTPEGMNIYMGMKQSFLANFTKHKALYDAYQINNQPYNYNHKKFLELNKFEAVG